METFVALLLLGAGGYFTIKTGFVQVRRFLPSVSAFFRGGERDGRRVSPFEAAATSLAATIGTGNIAGTAGALLIGGPGAIFWMWVSALLGMALKYVEILYAVRLRRPAAGASSNWRVSVRSAASGPGWAMASGCSASRFTLAQ